MLQETAYLKEKMTPKKRELILQRKHELMTSERMPSFSSYYIYKAVLKENITELDAIKDYIRAHGVLIS